MHALHCAYEQPGCWLILHPARIAVAVAAGLARLCCASYCLKTLWPLRTARLIIWHSEPAQWHHTGQNLIDAIWTSSSTVCAAAGRGMAVIWPQALSGKQLYPLRRHQPSVGRPLKRLRFLCCSCNLIHSDVGLGRMQKRPQGHRPRPLPRRPQNIR